MSDDMEGLRAEIRTREREDNIEKLAREMDPMAFAGWSDGDDLQREALAVAQTVVDSTWLKELINAAEHAAFERARHRIAIEVLRPVNAAKNPFDTPGEGE